MFQTTRIGDSFITCQSGGFIASGEVGKDKEPIPFQNPTNLKTFAGEGFGEVQTPLSTSHTSEYELGQPVFFRPAKSGEIAEHFRCYVLKRGDTVEKIVNTYRGDNNIFY